MMTDRLVRVTWLDAYGDGGEWAPDDSSTRKPLECESVGWVRQDDELVLVLVPHRTEGNDHAYAQAWGEIVIPKQGVIKNTEVT